MGRRVAWHGIREALRRLVTLGMVAAVVWAPAAPALAVGRAFSQVRTLDVTKFSKAFASGDSALSVFDVVVSLYNQPAVADRAAYEAIFGFAAEAVCEQTNGTTKLGRVRIFQNGIMGEVADVVWNASEWPRANPSGFGSLGLRIIFGDIFPDGCGTGCNIDYLGATRQNDAGYTIGHEWGHYVLGLYDEYQGSNPAVTDIYQPQTTDTPPSPSIMNNQWLAAFAVPDYDWLNHTTPDNYEADTAQGRVYGASSWETLVRPVGDDPRDGDRATLPLRVRYDALVGAEPTAADGWLVIDLPASLADCQSELEVIWMPDEFEMQVVFDKSGSMAGDPIADARTAAQTLVNDTDDGNTALGLVEFNATATQSEAITPIPSPGAAAVRAAINGQIASITDGGATALFDAADLALSNLQTYATTNGTTAAQLVFLLSDGEDNSSAQTEASVVAAYTAAGVPLSTFAFGDFAPDGVLMRLAEDTGGFFRATSTALNALTHAFIATKTALTPSVGLFQDTRIVSEGGVHTHSVQVDSGLSTLNFFANFIVARGRPAPVVSVFDPNGNHYAVPCTTHPLSDGSANHSCRAVDSVAERIGSFAGEWKMEFDHSAGTSSIVINTDITAEPLGGERVLELIAGTQTQNVVYPELPILRATLIKDAPVTRASVVATILSADYSTSMTQALNDDGLFGDQVASDGIYGFALDYKTLRAHFGVCTDEQRRSVLCGSPFVVQIEATNPGLTAIQTENSLLPAHPLSMTNGATGILPTPPPLPPIGEAFIRTASTQIRIVDFALDDHVDQGVGSPLQPDNADQAGNIDSSADVDRFDLPVGSAASLVVRVAGLAFGLQPELAVYSPSGQLLALVDMTSAGSAGYPSAYIDTSALVGTGASLTVEVRGAGGTTGAYLVSAGNLIASDQPVGMPAVPLPPWALVAAGLLLLAAMIRLSASISPRQAAS